jgi:hypothetical protein
MSAHGLPVHVPRFADFVDSPQSLTPDWMTALLRANNVAATVKTIDVQRIGTGQIGQNVRISMAYREGVGPATLVAKFMSPDPTSRATGIALGNYEREVAFYRDLAPLLRQPVTDMAVAFCWAAEFDAAREATVLVLDDLAPAEQGDQIAGCSLAYAIVAVKQAATFHAKFWGADLLRTHEWLKDPLDPERATQLKMLLGMFWPGFVERYRDRLTPDAKALGDRIAATADKWLLARSGPFTLTHGDYRLDNLLFSDATNTSDTSPAMPTSETGGRDDIDRVDRTDRTDRTDRIDNVNGVSGVSGVNVVAVDWQTPAIGLGGIDVGYFVGAGLLPDLRRAHERELVAMWHTQLLDSGVSDFTLENAWDDYRHGQFSGIITAVVASMITERTERGDEMFWAMAGRHLETALDTDAGSLLPNE